VDSAGSARWSFAATVAAMWCGLFACLHLFWALGGSIGLASSAGPDLAERRPTSFIIFGLFGTALLLLIGIAVIAVACSPRAPRRWPIRHSVARGRVAKPGQQLTLGQIPPPRRSDVTGTGDVTRPPTGASQTTVCDRPHSTVSTELIFAGRPTPETHHIFKPTQHPRSYGLR